MKFILNSIFIIVLGLPNYSFGYDVKGLELGQITSHQALADLFGNAECSTDKENIKLFGVYCTVPISYLGIKTTAEVKTDKQWVVSYIKIKIPYQLLPQVETYLTKQYSAPDVVRKSKKMLTNLRNLDGTAASPKEYSEPCSEWKNVNQVRIAVCERDIMGPNSSLTFSYKDPINIDETDV